VNGHALPDVILEVIRLDNFRLDHPDIAIGERCDVWRAVVPQDHGERFLARRSLTDLLDDLEVILAGGDPRADPD